METNEKSPYETILKSDKKKGIGSMFYYIHIWMLFTIIVCVFTAFVVKIPLDRNIIILEAFISAISTTIYYFLDKKIEANIKNNEPIDWKGMAILRYRGWTFSTPLMILGFLLFLSSTTKIALTFSTAFSCILLDEIMIFIGYLGELDIINRNLALITGFIPLILIFVIIFQVFLRNKFILINYVMFIFFVLFWSLYGIGFVWELGARNYLYNWLDLLSKSGFGFIFAIYFLYKRFFLK